MIPNAATQRENATRLLEAQTQAINATHLGETTPLLVPVASKPRPLFKTTELFGGR